jgi:hypothetical protein
MKTKKCSKCNNLGVLRHRTICSKCKSLQCAALNKQRFKTRNGMFSCEGCWGDFPKYRINQKVCRPCYLLELKEKFINKYKNP